MNKINKIFDIVHFFIIFYPKQLTAILAVKTAKVQKTAEKHSRGTLL